MDVSYIFTPAFRLSRKIGGLCLAADMMVVDLEDSIHPKRKKEAREHFRNFDLHKLGMKKIGLRVNSLESIFGLEDILFLKNMMKEKSWDFDSIFIPKITSKRDVEIAKNLLNDIQSKAKLISIIETQSSAENVDEIASLSDGLILGQADLVSELYSPNDNYILHVRSKICVAAAKYRIPAIDTNSFEISDMESVRSDCGRARDEGFIGKAAIHPCQIMVLNEVFKSRFECMDKYIKLIELYENSDEGFFILNGQVIAPPFISKSKLMLELTDENL